MYRYPVNLTKDRKSGQFTVTFPDIPEAITQGSDAPDALRHAVDALETALSMYMDDRREIPSAGKPHGHFVDLGPISAAKVALYTEMQAAGMKKAELARRLGWQKSQVDRLLDLMHTSKLDQLEKALAIFEKVIVLDVKRAHPQKAMAAS